jgi:LysR family nitrogen assimilation transcriptional regulator
VNLRRIEAFLAVSEARSISRAATQLEAAQSVVSRHIAALESELGYRLFERTGRGVAPTPAAQQLAPRLRKALDEMQRAAVEAAQLGDRPSGTVRVGVVPAAARPLVSLLYRRVAEAYPRVRLQFFEGFSNTLEERLSEGDLDLAVINRYGRARHRGEERLCVVESLVIGPPGAFAPARRELPFKALASLPLVLAPRPNGLRVALDQVCRREGVELQVAVEADSLPTMKDLVQHGGLYTVLPHHLVHDELQAGALTASRLSRPGFPRILSLAASTRHPGSAATRAVWREVRDVSQAHLAGKVWR